MYIKTTQLLTIAALFLFPVLAQAQLLVDDGDFETSILGVMGFINLVLVPLIFGLALLFFLWGVLKAFVIKGDEDSRKEGKQYMIWAIVGLVVMVSLWGIVTLLSGALGLGGQELDTIPDVPTITG